MENINNEPNYTHIPYYNGTLQVYIMEERVDYKAKELTYENYVDSAWKP